MYPPSLRALHKHNSVQWGRVRQAHAYPPNRPRTLVVLLHGEPTVWAWSETKKNKGTPTPTSRRALFYILAGRTESSAVWVLSFHLMAFSSPSPAPLLQARALLFPQQQRTAPIPRAPARKRGGHPHENDMAPRLSPSNPNNQHAVVLAGILLFSLGVLLGAALPVTRALPRRNGYDSNLGARAVPKLFLKPSSATSQSVCALVRKVSPCRL